MIVTKLQLRDFRNYATLDIEPGSGLNVVVGRNAQGKSNLLEAMYILATSKSTRAGKDTELIKFDTETAHIKAHVDRQRSSGIDIEMLLSLTEKKSARLNGVRYTKLAEVIGQMNAVLFDSGDLEIIRGDPSMRRRFLDLEISQTSPRYAHAFAAYRKTLDQRNRLLKDLRDGRAGADARAVMPAWNAQLARYGARLIERRRGFLERINIIARDMHNSLSDKRDMLQIGYIPSFDIDGAADENEIEGRFMDALETACGDEFARGVTLRGPQRDDVVFSVNDQDCRLYGSQGQQRTVALSLKLAERQLIEELVGEPPALLLDDVLSDLDDARRRRLFDLTAQAGSQTFLSCTNLRSFSKSVLENAIVYTVSGGEANRQ
jgi:DNA replication and repair protein RecF